MNEVDFQNPENMADANLEIPQFLVREPVPEEAAVEAEELWGENGVEVFAQDAEDVGNELSA